jgi:hypothetical protein
MPNESRRKSREDHPSVASDQRDTHGSIPEDAVRSRAYQLFEERGGQSGHDLDDWLQAERELRSSRTDE